MRPPTRPEIKLLKELFAKAKIAMAVEALQVEPMDDGGMGSLKLVAKHGSHKFGRAAAEIEAKDLDGVSFLATLYLDTEGKPFELDIFKSDFSPVLSLRDSY